MKEVISQRKHADILMESVGTSDVLSEELEEALADSDASTEELESWLTVVGKVYKHVILN